MKKLLSLALTLTIMTATASASLLSPSKGTAENPHSCNSGGSVKIGFSDFITAEGDKISSEVDFTDEFFVVSSKKFSKGASMIKSIAFVDDGSDGYCLKISTNQDYNNDISRYTETNPTYANVVFSELSLKAKKTVKDAEGDKILSKGKEYSFRGTGKLYLQVGYKFSYRLQKAWEDSALNPADGGGSHSGYPPAQTALNGIVIKKSDSGNTVSNYGRIVLDSDDLDLSVKYDTTHAYQFKSGTVGDSSYSYAVINATYGDWAYSEGRVYDGDKVIYRYNCSPDTKILKAYPDAELDFVNMKTTDLPATCYFELYADEEDYVYKVENDKLVPSGLKWDEDVYAWGGRYRVASKYVISDIPLSAAPTVELEPEQTIITEIIPAIPDQTIVAVNPETGR